MRVLAVGAHPDDVEVLCGGTLLRCVGRGDEVYIAYLARGDKGAMAIDPEALAATRRSEAEAAGKALGAKEVLPLGLGDVDIWVNRETQRLVVDLVRKARPDIIITHHPDDYMEDHRRTSQLVFDASFVATLPNYPAAQERPALTAIPAVYYMDTVAGHGFLPTIYVDISEVMDEKVSALACHRSQVQWLKDHDRVDILQFVRTVAAFRGLQCGVKYAEGFQQLQVWGRVQPARHLP